MLCQFSTNWNNANALFLFLQAPEILLRLGKVDFIGQNDRWTAAQARFVMFEFLAQNLQILQRVPAIGSSHIKDIAENPASLDMP